MKDWLRTRNVRLPFGIALLLTSAVSLMLRVIEPSVRIDGWFAGAASFAESLAVVVARIPFKDIFVNAVGGFLGGLTLLWLTVGSRGVRTLRSMLGRPSVVLVRGRAPKNIFKGLELEAPAQWIQQELGAPTRMRKGWWGYRFTDALVSLTFAEDDSLESVAVALTDPDATFDFPAWHFDCPPLGKATLKDVIDAEHLELQFRESTRHRELLMTGREGPRGAWHYIALGALSPHIPGPLLPSDFQWDREKQILTGRPEAVKINWAALSTRSEIQTFPWDFGITI